MLRSFLAYLEVGIDPDSVSLELKDQERVAVVSTKRFGSHTTTLSSELPLDETTAEKAYLQALHFRPEIVSVLVRSANPLDYPKVERERSDEADEIANRVYGYGYSARRLSWVDDEDEDDDDDKDEYWR